MPLLTPDSWGYLNPALSWLGGAGFHQTDGRAWFYPAILALTLKVGGDFSWIVRLQQSLCVAGAPLLWLGVRIWLSIFPSRSGWYYRAAVLLGAVAASIYVLNTTQVRFELTIQPEGVLAFFVLIYLVCALLYFRARWSRPQVRSAVVFGSASFLFSYAIVLLKPSWGFAIISSIVLLVAGSFGPATRSIRFIPGIVAVLLTGALAILPHLFGFQADLRSRTFLPFTLVSIHAAQIVQNAERHQLVGTADRSSDQIEARFYQGLNEAWSEARKVPLGCRTLGFAPDDIMYTKDFFEAFAAQQHLTDAALINLCYTVYLRAWLESPVAMLTKISKEIGVFLSAPSTDFSSHSISRRTSQDISVHFSPSPQVLLAEAEAKDYLRSQTVYVSYLNKLERVYQEGWPIDCLNWLRYLAILVAKLSSLIQIAFFLTLFPVFLNGRFSDLRLPALATVMVSAAVYGNMLTVSVIHSMDLDRYRTSYMPALLLTLTIMTAFIVALFERIRTGQKQSVPKTATI